MDTGPGSHGGALPAARKESVEGVLEYIFNSIDSSHMLIPLDDERKFCKSRGVRCGETYIGRRTLLTFTTSNGVASMLTHHFFLTDPVYLCICAAYPTTGARCTSEDFFICYPDTLEYQSVKILRVFGPGTTEDGTTRMFLKDDDYMRRVVLDLANKRTQAREAAKEARPQPNV